MNVFSTDQTYNAQQSFLNLVQESKQEVVKNNQEGDINLYNNELLTVWKNITPDVLGSTIRMGNFGRDQFGNIMNTNDSESYPALLFYRNTLSEDYPVLDIGVQVKNNQPTPVISFKKLEDSELVEYANIELDANNNLTTNSTKRIEKIKNNNNSVEIVKEVFPSASIESIYLDNEPIATNNGVLKDPVIINNYPKPNIEGVSNDDGWKFALILAGAIATFGPLWGPVIACSIWIGVKDVIINGEVTDQIDVQSFALYDRLKSDNSNSIVSQVFLTTEFIQYKNPFSIKDNTNVKNIIFQEDGNYLFKLNNQTGTQLCVDTNGKVGKLSVQKAIIEVKNN